MAGRMWVNVTYFHVLDRAATTVGGERNVSPAVVYDDANYETRSKPDRTRTIRLGFIIHVIKAFTVECLLPKMPSYIGNG